MLLSIGVLVFSILIMWYQLRCAVMDPVFRPKIINTPGRMGVFSMTRLCTTLLGVIGVWYSHGWLAGILTYVTTDIIRATLRKYYTNASIRSLTSDLLLWQKDSTTPVLPDVSADERLLVTQQAARETVEQWLRGKD